ncbi:MAG: calcium/sodium antiporter [Paludibacteraceae bacterium]
MILNIILIVIGFLFLIKGADWLVGGASGLAKKHHVSDLVIGLTIVAFGTSAPELAVNSVASFDKRSEIVFGNIIGSNNFNLFIILGIASLIFPITVHRSMIKKEIPFSLAITVFLILLSNAVLGQKENVLSRLDAFVLLLLFFIFIYYTFKQTKNDEVVESVPTVPINTSKIWSFIIFGLGLLIAGGRLVVTNAENIAQGFGVSEKIIALTIVAAGTSLPELVTSVVAAWKKNSDMAIGNVIGSNIFNILFILSVSGLIHPISYMTTFNREMILLTGGTVLLILFMFIHNRNKIDRWQGAILLGVFVAYTVFMIQQDL